MARRGPALVVLWIGLVVAFRLLHYGSEPIRQEAAATARVAGRLEARGWSRLPGQVLIADGSLTSLRYAHGACMLDLVVLPPDPALAEVVQSAWHGAAGFLWDGQLRPKPPSPIGRLAAGWQGARHWLGGPPPPPPFTLALAIQGERAGCLAGLDVRHLLD